MSRQSLRRRSTYEYRRKSSYTSRTARNPRDRTGKSVPLYAARIADLGPGDLVKIDCGACQHTALLTPAFLDRLGLSPQRKVLDLQDQVRCRGCGVRGRAVVSIKWAKGSVRYCCCSPPSVPTLHAAVMRTCSVPMLAEAIGSIAT